MHENYGNMMRAVRIMLSLCMTLAFAGRVLFTESVSMQAVLIYSFFADSVFNNYVNSQRCGTNRRQIFSCVVISAGHRYFAHHAQEAVPPLRDTAVALPPDRGHRQSRGPSRRNARRAVFRAKLDRAAELRRHYRPPLAARLPGRRQRRSNGKHQAIRTSLW